MTLIVCTIAHPDKREARTTKRLERSATPTRRLSPVRCTPHRAQPRAKQVRGGQGCVRRAQRRQRSFGASPLCPRLPVASAQLPFCESALRLRAELCSSRSRVLSSAEEARAGHGSRSTLSTPWDDPIIPGGERVCTCSQTCGPRQLGEGGVGLRQRAYCAGFGHRRCRLGGEARSPAGRRLRD